MAGGNEATALLTVVNVEKPGITKRPLPDFVKEALKPFVVG